jgi:hypothetical protein
VDVDEAGGHEPAGGVELAPPPLGHLADSGDAVAVDGDVGAHGAGAGAVDHVAPTNHDVVHPLALPGRCVDHAVMMSESSFPFASVGPSRAAVKRGRRGTTKRGPR